MKQKNSSPWDILGVQPNSTIEEIREAFKTLAMKYHPDRGGITEDFTKINEAYNKLKNKKLVPIVEVPSTKLVNLKLTLEQQINGLDDYIEMDNGVVINAKIPPGALAGDKYKLTNAGEKYILNIQELYHDRFERSGLSLMYKHKLDIITAMTGGSVQILGPTYDTITLDIPAGISNNESITVPYQGLISKKTKTRSNLFVSMVIDIPALDTNQKIEQLITRLNNVRN